jgi:hypothetical protein
VDALSLPKEPYKALMSWSPARAKHNPKLRTRRGHFGCVFCPKTQIAKDGCLYLCSNRRAPLPRLDQKKCRDVLWLELYRENFRKNRRKWLLCGTIGDGCAVLDQHKNPRHYTLNLLHYSLCKICLKRGTSPMHESSLGRLYEHREEDESLLDKIYTRIEDNKI